MAETSPGVVTTGYLRRIEDVNLKVLTARTAPQSGRAIALQAPLSS